MQDWYKLIWAGGDLLLELVLAGTSFYNTVNFMEQEWRKLPWGLAIRANYFLSVGYLLIEEFVQYMVGSDL